MTQEPGSGAAARARLAEYPSSLLRDHDAARLALAGRMSPRELDEWSAAGLELAAISMRAWESADEFFKATPLLIERVPVSALRFVHEYGRSLTTESSTLGAAFFRSAAPVLERLTLGQLRDWAGLARQLYKGTWKSSSLAGQFLEVSPALFAALDLPEARALVNFLETLSVRSYELSVACLNAAPRVLSTMERHDRAAFLGFAGVIAETSWADARAFFEHGARLLQQVGAGQRGRFLMLAGAVARRAGRQAYPFFAEAAEALARVDEAEHPQMLGLAESLAAESGPAAMEFLKSAPRVRQRLRMEDVAGWHEVGRRILASSVEGGEAYFRLESSKGEEVIESLSARVELSRVSEILRMYCKALTGTPMTIQSVAALAEKGVGWVDEDRPSTEGTHVYLPPVVERHGSKEENFGVYKVYSTHQAAHLEFRSFDFRFERPGSQLETTRVTREPAGREPALTDMERFFDLFADRRLAADLFTAAEDTRVDAAVKREYSGIRRTLERVQQDELLTRPEVRGMPLRQAFAENAIRASLGGEQAIAFPAVFAPMLGRAIGVLRILQRPGAMVEDSAEATLRLYEIAEQIRNVVLQSAEFADWPELEADIEAAAAAGMTAEGVGGEGGQPTVANVPEGEEQPYQSPPPVDFRGDFKPELVQLLMRMKAEQSGGRTEGQYAPLTPEQLQQLLEKSVEIDISNFVEGDLDSSSGMFLSNLMKAAGTPASEKGQQRQPSDGAPAQGAGDEEESLQQEVQYFYYDEWDFRAADYKPGWCRIIQQTLDEGEDEFFERTLREQSGLVAQTRKQFELLKPELYRKIKRLYDGEEYDLDAAIEYMVERRSRRAQAEEKVYWRRNKVERDVAVAFLLDMSASTDEEITRREQKPGDDDFDDDPRRYLAWWAQKKARERSREVKRIIDIEKESTVLLMEALETIGDSYGIFGFSGYGRECVEFYVVKGLEEPFGDAVKRRIDKIMPIRSTRMGPAIRHAAFKLDQHDAKVKILVLLSDGRPQDHGYGRDRTEKEYAIHDTKMALNEAKRRGITPFCLTVDRAGHDYLKTMCEDIGYEVVADVQSLPSRLPTLYRRLTE